jgi:DNA-directed RNA polymerase specialized sigma24 family protein
MKTLDALLYQWVGETDESRMDSAFRAYYSAAFPCLVRHVQNRTGWDRGSAEDIAQEALLRFLDRAGRGRQEAGVLVRTGLMRLSSVQVTVVDSRQVARWASDVGEFADSVINFEVPSGAGMADGDWVASIGALSAQVGSLQRRGWCLLEEARRNILHENAGSREPSAMGPLEDAADPQEREIARFARELSWHPAAGTSPDAKAKDRYPGVGRLAEAVLTVIGTLPRLRLPSNGFLFEIATTTLLDEIKRRRRRKRGGLDVRAAEHEASGWRLSGRPIEGSCREGGGNSEMA